jgi:ABC-type transporter Mla subunit MlaD
MKEIERSIAKLEAEVDSDKQQIQRLKGQREVLVKRLNDELGVDNLDDASALLAHKVAEKASLEQRIREKYEKLSSDYTW